MNILTSNGHQIRWVSGGIVKHFRDYTEKRLVRIAEVYDAHLEHVEWGSRKNGRAILITRVGLRLKDALHQRLVTTSNAVKQIRRGLDELHGIGYGHCDLVLDNVFFDEETGTVFLGDLEYLTPIGETPDDADLTAKELDEAQLNTLIEDIERAV
jgi:tRNA A-37 threonylcarbamoyl transferase component Bud32